MDRSKGNRRRAKRGDHEGIIQNKCSGVKDGSLIGLACPTGLTGNGGSDFRPLNAGGKFATVGAGDGELAVRLWAGSGDPRPASVGNSNEKTGSTITKYNYGQETLAERRN